MKLTRDSNTGAYYTEDRLFKIQRCTVRAHGRDISKRRENGMYKIKTSTATLPEAHKLVIGKGGKK